MIEYSFFATTAKGIEPLLYDELKKLGAKDTKETVLGVSFNASIETAYRICLYSRLSHQVLLKLKESDIQSPEDLYDEVKKINWLEHINHNSSIKIDASGKHKTMNNTQFIAQKAKDAIVDQIRDIRGSRPSVKNDKPDVIIQVHIAKNKLTISLSLSGISLHRRGYRLETGLAPIKETLACAILYRANWHKQILTDDASLIDPMCGSGTLLIEAALIAYEIAPGIDREYYGFFGWLKHEKNIWQALITEAKEKRQKNLANPYTEIIGFDIDPKQIDIAKSNIKRAGLEKVIKVKTQALDQLQSSQITHHSGLIITNPPYGERLLSYDNEKLNTLISQFGHLLKNQFKNWKLSIFSANPQSIKSIGLRSHKHYKLYNGTLEAQLLNFNIDESAFMKEESELDKLKRKSETHYQNPSDGLVMFENRLKKNLKAIARWAKRKNINAYRIYDQDLPEYALAVDCYNHLVHIQEYQAGKNVDPLKAKRRLYEAIAVIKHTLNVPYESIFIKMRKKQKGASQYERLDQTKNFHIIQEDIGKFYVNLNDYLDTGLFLDHRLMRLKVAKASKNKTLLNLFAYTSTASTLAALYGAKSVTSVDLSNTYLNWGKRNFELNNITLKRHQFIQADCLEWLQKTQDKYDVIFLDPPTFSNSKRMQNTLDIQRDHVELINFSMKHLKQNGVLYFSNNYRRFKLDQKISNTFEVIDISHQSLDEDFKRRPNIHHAFEIKHKK